MNRGTVIDPLRAIIPSSGWPVREVELPEAARALSTLPSVDYEDAFLVEIGPDEDRTPLQWARAILEGAPITFRTTAPWVWLALGLKHGSTRSDRFVLGWEVRRNTPEFALLGGDSRVGMPAELLIKRGERDLLFATLIRHENPVARRVWARIAPMHRQVVRRLLEQTSRPCGASAR